MLNMSSSCETGVAITVVIVISRTVLDMNYSLNTLFSILLNLFIFSMFIKLYTQLFKSLGLLRFGLKDINLTNLKLWMVVYLNVIIANSVAFV